MTGNTAFLMTIADVNCFGVIDVPAQDGTFAFFDLGMIGAEVDADTLSLDVNGQLSFYPLVIV